MIKKDKHHNNASDNESDIDTKLNSSNEKSATKLSSTAANADEIENIDISPQSKQNDRISIIGSAATDHKIDKLEDDDTNRNKLETIVTKTDVGNGKNTDNVEYAAKADRDQSDITPIENNTTVAPNRDEEKASKEDFNAKESSEKVETSVMSSIEDFGLMSQNNILSETKANKEKNSDEATTPIILKDGEKDDIEIALDKDETVKSNSKDALLKFNTDKTTKDENVDRNPEDGNFQKFGNQFD